MIPQGAVTYVSSITRRLLYCSVIVQHFYH